MEKFFARFDDIAGINQENLLAKWLERIAFIFLILLVLSAPHSIAATQISWLCGTLAWVIRLFVSPRPRFVKNRLNIALLIFGLWSVVSSIFSYAPDISLDKLRGVSLFFIFFFVINNLRHNKAVIFLAFALIVSCSVNVIMTPLQRVVGRGVEVSELRGDSPLVKVYPGDKDGEKVRDGDTLLSINKKKVHSPEDILAEIERQGIIKLRIYRPDYEMEYNIRQADLLPGESASERLGIGSWKKSRTWRSAGFFGHYTTYAEILQMISSLIFGLLIAAFVNSQNRKIQIILAVTLGAFLLALLLTVTRASQAAFMISAFFIVLIGASRKVFLTLLLVSLPLAAIGLYVLQQSRNVGFYDLADNSITWRKTVYGEAVDLATDSPRHLAVGVGMDSIKRYAKDWRLFDDGRLPSSHFHSTPLQLAVERGLPALAIWLWIIWLYGNTLWRKLKADDFSDWRERGVVLGAFGGMIGFFASGLVHYNLGDGEIAMVFYLLMGLSVFLAKDES
jgi:hypothetical protein